MWTEVKCCLSEWEERVQKFRLELQPDKTRLIEFARCKTSLEPVK
jgi:hypothetical protein